MAWDDFLYGLSGGLSGIVKGIDAGMAPLKTWEGIRTTDLQNDLRDIQNRDAELMQAAREGSMDYDYYGNKIGAEDVGFRQKMASGERDIFGNQQALDMARYFSDPSGFFQLAARERGLTPDMPEYRQFLQEQLATFDPMAAIAADKNLNIRGIQQQNMNEQSALAYIQNWVRQNSPDPNAEVVRGPNGEVYVRSGGEMHLLSDMAGGGAKAVQLAAMLGDVKGPYSAILSGVTNAQNIQKTNAQIVKDLQSGAITPAMAYKDLVEQGVQLRSMQNDARLRLQNHDKIDTKLMSDEEKAQHLAARQQLVARIDMIQQQSDQAQQLRNRLVSQGRGVPMGGGAVAPRAGVTGRGPGTAVTAPRFDAQGRVVQQPRQLPLGVEEVDPYGAGSGYGGDVLSSALLGQQQGPTGYLPPAIQPQQQSGNSYWQQVMQMLNQLYGVR